MKIIPKIIPIIELKNTGNISKHCAEHDDAVKINEALNSKTRKENKVELTSFIEELIND